MRRYGWFLDFYNESRQWLATPPWFRPWIEHEQSARILRGWTCGLFPGLLQTEDYARAVLATEPGVSDDQIAERAAARMARQRALTREDPPAVWLLVDKAAMYRRVGSAKIMAAQLRHLATVASLPSVTVQVVPCVEHAGMSGSLSVADNAAYIDTPVGGMVFEDANTVRSLTIRFDTIRASARPRQSWPPSSVRQCYGMTTNWRKSSYSSNGGEACVEAASGESAVLVRDTTDRDGAILNVPADAWRVFMASTKRG